MTPISGEQPEENRGEAQGPRLISRRTFRQLTAPERDRSYAEPSSSGYQPVQPSEEPTPEKPKRPFHWPFHFLPAFWTITGLISLCVNVILIVVLIALANQLFSLKAVVENQLIGGLARNFQLMDQAHITTSVTINTSVPAKFTLPLETDTTVTLTNPTLVTGTRVSLATGGLTITDAATNIVLPAGTQLPVHLSLSVPVDQQIPVNLTVPVNIPLNQTELHQPFVGLQDVVQPYQKLLSGVPDSWEKIICGAQPSDFCKSIIP